MSRNMPRSSRYKQAGFTLVEIAIVLVIIGLLLGGVLKGQELINSAKVKNFATDFRNIPLFIYGYQDKFKSLPGDDRDPVSHVAGTLATNGTVGNAVIEGDWDSVSNVANALDESYLFWQHARLAGLAAGPTNTADTNYAPRNADGGLIGLTSNLTATPYIANMKGTYLICSAGILGKYAKQLDTTIDDGCTNTGSMQSVANQPLGSTTNNVAVGLTAAGVCPGAAQIDDSASYTVCMGI
jgi:prepilin-type N-terminal cleavage/methylation domain-containing protein